MACQKVIVMMADKLYIDDFRHKRKTLVIEHLIDFLPVFTTQLLGFDTFKLRIGLLQLF